MKEYNCNYKEYIHIRDVLNGTLSDNLLYCPLCDNILIYGNKKELCCARCNIYISISDINQKIADMEQKLLKTEDTTVYIIPSGGTASSGTITEPSGTIIYKKATRYVGVEYMQKYRVVHGIYGESIVPVPEE